MRVAWIPRKHLTRVPHSRSRSGDTYGPFPGSRPIASFHASDPASGPGVALNEADGVLDEPTPG